MWAIGYCGRHFSFLLKTDDDTFNVLQRFVEYLDSLANVDEDNFAFVGGYCASGDVPHRRRSHKWFVPYRDYPGPVFPHHCKVSTVQCYIHLILLLGGIVIRHVCCHDCWCVCSFISVFINMFWARISRKWLEIETRFQWTTGRKWHGEQMVT